MVSAESKSPAARSSSSSEHEEHKEAASPLPSAQQPTADVPAEHHDAALTDTDPDDKAAFAAWTAECYSASPRPDSVQVRSSLSQCCPASAACSSARLTAASRQLLVYAIQSKI
jgi:hypothetical protein